MSSRHFKRLRSQGIFRALSYYAFTVGFERLGIQYLHCFRLARLPEFEQRPASIAFAILRTTEDLTAHDREVITMYSGVEHLRQYEAAFARGELCAVARWNGDELACECWISQQSDYFLAPGNKSWFIERCLTVPAYRGHGLYPQTLKFACESVLKRGTEFENIYIECNAFNSASLQGIMKAGFTLAGKRLTFRKWRWQWISVTQSFGSAI